MKNDMNQIRKLIFSKPPLYKILLAITIVYFIVFAILMVHTDGQPDQSAHLYYSRRYSETWGIPAEDQNPEYITTGQPYLYYWLNGAVFKIFKILFPASQLNSILLWRLMSVILSSFTIFYTYKFAKIVTNNPYASVLSAFFLSNTLMFVFVSGGISYDNLMNLAAIASIYHLVLVYKGKDFMLHTTFTGIWVIIGSLAKEQFLLLTLIVFIAWLFFLIRNFKRLTLLFTQKNMFISLIFIGFLVLFVGLYGTNLIRYSRTTPACIQIKGPNLCRTYDYMYEYFEPFNLQWMWFVRDDLINPIKYLMTYWGFKMVESIWGILSSSSFVPLLSVSLHGTLLIWTIFCYFYYKHPKDKIVNLLSLILLSYCGYVFLWNYKTEVEFSFQHFGVTGRYLLPMLGVLVTLIVYSFLHIRSTLVKRLTIALAVILYFFGGLGMYFSRYAEVFSHWRIYF